jgi:amino acid permease
MKVLKVILFVVAIIAIVVTCDNTQAIREKINPNKTIFQKGIEKLISKGETA